MATYKGIQGYSVQSLATDPTVADTVGQLWYNSGSGKFKISTEGAGAWSSGVALNTARDLGAAAGTQTAALFAGGEPPNTAKTEIYDGTTWTEVGDLVSGSRYALCGFGTTTAAIAAGGHPPAAGGNFSETWDGTSWSEGNNMNTPRYNFGSAIGSPSTAGLVMGGITSPGHGNDTADAETYDGTCWAEVNNMTTTRAAGTGTGISTAALVIGGVTNSITVAVANVEEYDGTSWSETADILTATYSMGTAGTTTLALGFGGLQPGKTAETEKFDGTSWTNVASLAAARSGLGGAGSGVAGLGFGGTTPSVATTATEEWNDPVYAIKTVTVS